jgi:hypothetical protein
MKFKGIKFFGDPEVEMARSHSRRRQRGGGYQQSQQWFDPAVYPPQAGLISMAPSSAPTTAMIRPVLASTFQAGGGRGRTRKHGGGYQTSQQFLNPDVYPPSAGLLTSAPSTAPTASEVRPVLLSTFPTGQSGGRRGTRRMKGGFSPSIMGGFVANAQAVAVPLVLYLAYHTMVPKKGAKTRRTSRK